MLSSLLTASVSKRSAPLQFVVLRIYLAVVVGWAVPVIGILWQYGCALSRLNTWVHKPDSSLCHGFVRRIFNLLWILVPFFICLGVVDGLYWVVQGLPSYCSVCSEFLQISIVRSSVSPDLLRSLARTLLLQVPVTIRSRSNSSSRAPYSHVLIRCLSLIRYAPNFSPCSCVQELNIYRWYMIFCLGSK